MHRYKLLLSLIVGTGCSAAALYLAFRNVPLAALGSYIVSVHPLWTMVAAALVILNFVVRVWRWRLILADSAKVDFWPAFHPLMIGFMMNCILPGRIGEIARPAILSKRAAVPFATGLATVATERAFDALILIALFAWTMTSANIDPGFHMDIGGIVLNRQTLIQLGKGTAELCVLLIAGIALVGYDTTRKGLIRVLFWVSARFPKSMEGPLQRFFTRPMVHLIEKAALGFRMIQSPKKMGQCLLLSVLVWAIAWLSYHAMVMGAPGIHLGLRETAVMMTIICFVIAIPSVPGFWGIWEAGGVFALSLFGIGQQEAAGFTLVNHAVQMFPVILIGIGSAVVTGINIVHVSREIHSQTEASKPEVQPL
uniref:Flippase-like domain-containing protein n=1 Tax=Desulfatirhabdium butyrativorans TaxID=340467 RepID=A0A7C4VYJ4_9BACT